MKYSNTLNYVVLVSTILLIVYSLFRINGMICDECNVENNFTFTYPFIIVVSLFLGFYTSSLIVHNIHNRIDKLAGIFYLLIIGVILLISNFYVFDTELMTKQLAGKKFSKIGVVMLIGIGSIIFGFIDNFGMQIGIDALDDLFVHSFLHPLSNDTRFTKHKINIEDNLLIMNEWTEHNWRKVVDQVLRHKDDLEKDKKYKDIYKVLKDFHCKPLKLPKEIKGDDHLTNEYINNLRNKFDIIYSAKAMLGNTFSNFCAALLSAAVIGIFTFLTAYDEETDIGDTNLQKKYSDIVKHWTPLIEAVFIVIGCLIPIFLNIAMKNSKFDNINHYAWIIVITIVLLIFFMMYFSSKNITTMNSKNKTNGILNTLNKLKVRYNINDKTDQQLNEKINEFIQNISSTSLQGSSLLYNI